MTPITAAEVAALPRMAINPLRDPNFVQKQNANDADRAAKRFKTNANVNSVTVAAHCTWIERLED